MFVQVANELKLLGRDSNRMENCCYNIAVKFRATVDQLEGSLEVVPI